MEHNLRNDQRGIAVYWIRAIIAVIACNIIWYVGNVVLFSDHGLATVVDNLDNTIGPITNMGSEVEWFWTYAFPWVILIGAAIYVIYSALLQEPTTRRIF
jgi:uncharacterized membrane protein (DUF106 family)